MFCERQHCLHWACSLEIYSCPNTHCVPVCLMPRLSVLNLHRSQSCCPFHISVAIFPHSSFSLIFPPIRSEYLFSKNTFSYGSLFLVTFYCIGTSFVEKIKINPRWRTKWNINYKHLYNVHAVKMEICVTLYFLLIGVSKRHNTKLLDLIRSHANCIHILHIEHSKSVICVPWCFWCHLRSQLFFCFLATRWLARSWNRATVSTGIYSWSNRWTFLQQFSDKNMLRQLDVC